METETLLASNWSVLFNLTKRHFLVFFRNKIRMLYTLLVPIIVFVIYLLILRNLEGEMLISQLKDLGLIVDGQWKIAGMEKDCFTMMDFWMLSGILGISAITISIQSNNIMVNDKENGVNRDFVSSPINNKVLISSYFLFNFLITFFLCFIFLLICLVYLLIAGEFTLNILDFLLILAMLALACIFSTLFTIFICAFIKREPTLASIIAIFSSAVGFLVGAYMPFGLFPKEVESVCCLLPSTHNVSLLRYSFLKNFMVKFENVYKPQLDVATYNSLMGKIDQFGYNLHFFGNTVTPNIQLLVVVGSILLFAFLNLFAVRFISRVEDR